MDPPRSRLPRAASNPSIRPLLSTATSQPSTRLPPPVRLGKLPTLSRQPSVPLRVRSQRDGIPSPRPTSGTKSQPSTEANHSLNKKKLLPSRSTLGLSKHMLDPKIQSRPSPLGPKRTITAASRTPSSSSSISKKPNKVTPPSHRMNGSTPGARRIGSNASLNARTVLSVKRESDRPTSTMKSKFFGVDSPSKTNSNPITATASFQTFSTPSKSGLPSCSTQTPILPRLVSTSLINSTTKEPNTLIKDTELSFVDEGEDDDDDDHDQSHDLTGSGSASGSGSGYGFATSRFERQDRPIDLSQLVSRPHTDVGYTTPSSPLGKAFMGTSRELILAREERDKLREQLKEREREIVLHSWGEVVRATEMEMEELSSSKATLSRLKSLLKLSGNTGEI
ncbi:hypothetical protein CI109_105272 [Kwoniella shandongensis]|uniref:Uncharacterized protein n=1 Tax=Kwoniella shandongensis TaxID=1734106 RepID=A0A5M6C921_9TREE|nr:uncharacterized protein CI109_002115 [Kwoniella shandongensis]KAA5529689.1 hypothetical protein CI109_002115 [Kwoniella shandongensis]